MKRVGQLRAVYMIELYGMNGDLCVRCFARNKRIAENIRQRYCGGQIRKLYPDEVEMVNPWDIEGLSTAEVQSILYAREIAGRRTH